VQEFWSLDFEVSPAALIPRPETELLVEEALRHAAGSSPRIADIGTGSGNIAVALARELPGSRIVATDVSGAALELARRNARRAGTDPSLAHAAPCARRISPAHFSSGKLPRRSRGGFHGMEEGEGCRLATAP
jgi:methylase of polypeptide subunit release factors